VRLNNNLNNKYKMTLETEIYQVLRKHRLPLKKREELIIDLLNLINEREKQLLIHSVSNALDLVELQRKIDEALDSETSESLKEWLHSKRL
jgi:hypothetical protein